MAITLYTISGSPFAWRCHLTLEHKKLPHEVRILSASEGELKGPEYLKINPRGRVPSLTDGDLVLYESPAIVEYLEDAYPNSPRVFPADPRARARVRRLVHEVDFDVSPNHLLLAYELYFKPKEDWIMENVERAKLSVLDEIGFFEKQFEGDFLAGELGAADFALYPFMAHLRRFEMRLPDLGLTETFGPKLRAWMERIEALPYFDRTYPPHWKS